jgi:hypothetical protein
MLDWMALDRELAAAVAAWRRAARDADEDGFDAAILDPDRIGEIAEQPAPFGPAYAAWLRELDEERAGWSDRIAIVRAWAEPRPMPERDRDKLVSLAALRRDLLAVSASVAVRESAERALAAHAGPLSDLVVAAVERRFERQPGAVDVALAPPGLGARLAELVLAKSDALARDLLPGGVAGVVQAAMAPGAEEGWPPRILPRWLADVVRPSGLLAGLRVDIAPRLEALGPSSFARALGSLGVAVLAAGRPASVPLALHRHPRGSRRDERFALFASIAAEPVFARRVLGHGRERAKSHARAMATAALAWLRLEALGVLCFDALASGRAAARDRLVESGAAVFGSPPAPSLLGVLPSLRARAAPRLVGAVLAAPRRAELCNRHDEDWFQNPRAAEELRHEDTLPFADDALELHRLERALDRVVAELGERAD